MTALFIRVTLFVAFLLPVTTGYFSVNYSFLFYALFIALQAKRIEKPGKLLLAAIAVYAAIYLVGLGFDIFAPQAMLLRRGVSFAIFMTMFAFAVVPFGALETRAFKIAVVAVSFGFSIYAISRFYSVGGNSYGFSLKDVSGSQRYGFVYLLAIFCVITTHGSERWFRVGRAITLFVILAGLLLTFSRSSIVALGCVLPLFLLAPFVAHVQRDISRLAAVGRRTGIAAIYTIALFAIFPVTFQFYGDLILSRYAPMMEVAKDPMDAIKGQGKIAASLAPDQPLIAEGSEGTRLKIWKTIITHTVAHPVNGSSYLGAWYLDGVKTGSAHSQYFDVLLRTGIPGAILYLLILGQVLLFLWRKEPGLFWGTLAVLVFGLFHETFKESQGAFILACLIGMYSAYTKAVPVRAQATVETALPAPLAQQT